MLIHCLSGFIFFTKLYILIVIRIKCLYRWWTWSSYILGFVSNEGLSMNVIVIRTFCKVWVDDDRYYNLDKNNDLQSLKIWPHQWFIAESSDSIQIFIMKNDFLINAIYFFIHFVLSSMIRNKKQGKITNDTFMDIVILFPFISTSSASWSILNTIRISLLLTS